MRFVWTAGGDIHVSARLVFCRKGRDWERLRGDSLRASVRIRVFNLFFYSWGGVWMWAVCVRIWV